MEEIEARMAMRNKDNVASMSVELLELPLASWHEILTVRQTFAATGGTMGTKNGSKSKSIGAPIQWAYSAGAQLVRKLMIAGCGCRSQSNQL